jgi:hypothetical protein
VDAPNNAATIANFYSLRQVLFGVPVPQFFHREPERSGTSTNGGDVNLRRVCSDTTFCRPKSGVTVPLFPA